MNKLEMTVVEGAVETIETDALVVNLFEGVTSPGGATGAVDTALEGAVGELIEAGDLRGKAGELAVLYPRGAIAARRVIVAGLGERDSLDPAGIRRTAAAAARRARELGAESLATIAHGAGIGDIDAETSAQATAEGTRLGLYRYPAAKSDQDPRNLQRAVIIENDPGKLDAFRAGVRTAVAVGDGAVLARDLVNMPANEATPRAMAREASHIAEDLGMRCEVGGRDWAASHDMGAFLAVAQGAGEPPRFIVLEHGADREEAPIVIVGKGITFDSGGVSIKGSAGLERMKSDMAGAAAVLGAMRAIAALGVERRVVGLAPCTENMLDANAYRPGDVLTASDGTTIEVISTDAEGRLVLADALIYARRFSPKAIVDIATLTGASVVALGAGVAAGMFASDDALAERIEAASERTGEKIWRLPLWPQYRESLRSEVADLKNSGGRMGGVGTSAVFLQHFTEGPWAHLDIAGMALNPKENGLGPAGATGFGVGLLVDLIRRWSD